MHWNALNMNKYIHENAQEAIAFFDQIELR